MNFVFKVVALGGFTMSLGLLGCSAAVDNAEATSAPEVDVQDEDTLSPQSAIVVGGFTIDAQTPTMGWVPLYGGLGFYAASAKVVISGGTGTAKMGVCGLVQYKTGPGYASGSPRACSTANDCADIAIPAGGFRYCAAVDSVGQKYCFLRIQPPNNSCAGTPANGGVAIGNGTYNSPFAGPALTGSNWISYACFAGCATTDPSVQSAAQVAP